MAADSAPRRPPTTAAESTSEAAGEILSSDFSSNFCKIFKKSPPRAAATILQEFASKTGGKECSGWRGAVANRMPKKMQPSPLLLDDAFP
ncbi:hypothetical protein [Candidatus Laterigemmans baculatus]|uniref:hypothetical protein n=1 Tax=Candidatus Laterigemmans baculatus TaxID=2770505 RepID=UPI0013D9D094|nr:hypothetical protein [Candidatus Laterigemmans baculatus]